MHLTVECPVSLISVLNCVRKMNSAKNLIKSAWNGRKVCCKFDKQVIIVRRNV